MRVYICIPLMGEEVCTPSQIHLPSAQCAPTQVVHLHTSKGAHLHDLMGMPIHTPYCQIALELHGMHLFMVRTCGPLRVHICAPLKGPHLHTLFFQPTSYHLFYQVWLVMRVIIGCKECILVNVIQHRVSNL